MEHFHALLLTFLEMTFIFVGLGMLYSQRRAIGKAPFYVSEMSPKVHHCMGGMATNVATAVLDVETDQPIPGLFAAGEFVGGIHGAVMDCLVNGRQAGLSAAKDKL